MNSFDNQDGFTLIEALVAMTIFAIGVISLYTMHTVAIKGNATANALSTSTNLGAATVEQTIASNFDDLTDADGDGCAGLDDIANPDAGPTVDGVYTYYTNVADDCSLLGIPDTLAEQQRPKHVRVIVFRNVLGDSKKMEFNYVKQNPLND